MTERRPSQPALDPERARSPKPTVNRSIQRTMVVELIVGGLAMFALLLGAVYIGVLRPQLQNSPALVRPTLEAYMAAAADSDAVAAHRLFSRAGLRSVALEDLAASFAADRSLFEGFDRFQFTSFSRSPAGTVADNDLIAVEAAVLYESMPPALLSAELELEDDAWRLRSISVARPETEPSVIP